MVAGFLAPIAHDTMAFIDTLFQLFRKVNAHFCAHSKEFHLHCLIQPQHIPSDGLAKRITKIIWHIRIQVRQT